MVGAFPDGQSALILVAARLRHVAGTRWGSWRYLDMTRLRELEAAKEASKQVIEPIKEDNTPAAA